MRPGAHPIGEQILVDLLVPPIGACVWWVMARGWGITVQSRDVTDDTKKRQKLEFWLVLGIVSVLMFGITIYGYFTG